MSKMVTLEEMSARCCDISTEIISWLEDLGVMIDREHDILKQPHLLCIYTKLDDIGASLQQVEEDLGDIVSDREK